MPDKNMEEMYVVTTLLPPVINTKYKSTPNCAVPACESFHLDREKKRTPGVVKHNLVERKEGSLERDKYQVGDLVSTKKFVVVLPGRLLEGYGRKIKNYRYHGGSVFNDT